MTFATQATDIRNLQTLSNMFLALRKFTLKENKLELEYHD